MNDTKACRIRGQIMKIGSTRLALPIAVLAVVYSAPVRTEDSADFSKQALQAKIEYCKTCHGTSGQGFQGSTPIPRIAGQQIEYLENQLRAFIERRRENKYMYDVAHVLSPAMRTSLAQHFRDLNPKPLGGAQRRLVVRGKTIYEDGIPETNVPACMACHGADGKGREAIPRLAGQLHDYTINKLVNWNKERGQDPKHPDISAIMLPTSHNLTKAQIEEVAAYVSYLQ